MASIFCRMTSACAIAVLAVTVTSLDVAAQSKSVGNPEPWQLLIAPGDPKTFTGTHQLRMSTASDGALVGCVPCLNIFTSIAIFDGGAYGLLGYTIGHRSRYRVVHRGAVMPVQSIMDSKRIPAPLIEAVRGIDGCKLPPGDIFEHLQRAMVRGVCLAN